jgi:hypothetical protein
MPALRSSFLVDISSTEPRQAEINHGARALTEQLSVAGLLMRSVQVSDEIDDDFEDDDEFDDEDETRDEDDNDENDDDAETETWQVH